MRLWSLHPSYLDPQGLVAAWREALLAQKVLEGATRGYTHHPQLERFRQGDSGLALLGLFLSDLAKEGERRGYRLDRSRVRHYEPGFRGSVPVGEGQLRYELELLRLKLESRSPAFLESLPRDLPLRLNIAFVTEPGGIEGWERPRPEVLARYER